MKKKDNNLNNNDGVSRRLDALIRLTIESRYLQEKTFNESIAARTLKSAGLTPTEIAHILGKKSASDVAPYLYGKVSKREH
jgi:hypothetical protein